MQRGLFGGCEVEAGWRRRSRRSGGRDVGADADANVDGEASALVLLVRIGD